jgi:hypothetical protein
MRQLWKPKLETETNDHEVIKRAEAINEKWRQVQRVNFARTLLSSGISDIFFIILKTARVTDFILTVTV